MSATVPTVRETLTWRQRGTQRPNPSSPSHSSHSETNHPPSQAEPDPRIQQKSGVCAGRLECEAVTVRRRCCATSGERSRHYRVGLLPAPRLALWSSRKRADVAEVVANLSTGVTNSEPSSRIDSYHPNETSQVRPLDRALRFGDASDWGPPIGRVVGRDYAVRDMGRYRVEATPRARRVAAPEFAGSRPKSRG
jgi:hypothetical protein